MRTHHFQAQNCPLGSNKNFLRKLFQTNHMHFLAPVTGQNLKKPLEQIKSYEDVRHF